MLGRLRVWSERECFATPRFCRIVAVLGFLECRSDTTTFCSHWFFEFKRTGILISKLKKQKHYLFWGQNSMSKSHFNLYFLQCRDLSYSHPWRNSTNPSKARPYFYNPPMQFLLWHIRKLKLRKVSFMLVTPWTGLQFCLDFSA